MTPKRPLLSGVEVIKALERSGFTHVPTKGSHAKLRNSNGRTAVVPLHHELAQAGLTTGEFLGLLT